MSSRHFTSFALCSALIVAFAGSAAQAVPFEIATKNRNYCCDSVFIAGVPQPAKGYHTVKAVASPGPKGNPITLPFGHAINFFDLIYETNLPIGSLKTNIGTASIFNAAGVLMNGGGNAFNFSFCPKYVGLPVAGANCNNPAKATPAVSGFNGQVKVTTGPNKFGATMQILGGPNGIAGSKFFVVRYVGPNMTQLPAAHINARFNDSLIGAKTPGKFKITPAPGMTGYPPDYDSTSNPNQKLWQQGAGPFTTGKVTLKITMQANLPTRSVMLAGYDNRTAGGKGNVQVVSGILSNGYDTASPGGTPIGHKMRISFIPEPSASLGFAAGAIGLFLVGLRRRGSKE